MKMRRQVEPPVAEGELRPEDVEDAVANEVTSLVTAKAPKGVVVTDSASSSCCDSSSATSGLRVLCDQFGSRLLLLLFATQHVMKGFTSSFIAPAVPYMYKSYNVPAPRQQIFSGVTQLPWAMKPIIGLISDAVPICGYHKAPYMVAATFLGVGAVATIGLVGHDTLSVTNFVICIFLLQLQMSTCDLLVEAKYAERMRSKPAYGPALMTFVWFGLNAGGLVATAFAGPVLARFGNRSVFLISVPLLASVLMPLMRNYLEETPRSAEELSATWKQLSEQKEACYLCLLMFAGTCVLTVLGIVWESVWLNAVAAITVAIIMLVSFSVVLRPVIAKVNAFFLIQTSVGFSISGAAFYFYTDDDKMFKDGPHFSKEFFVSVIGIVSAICSLVGVYTYQQYASDWTYRKLLFWTNIVASVLSMSDVIFFKRWNKVVGIPDEFFVLGSSVCLAVVAQWMWMPGVVILSQLCPPGMEATMYALLAGCHNLGNTISSNCGAWVLSLLKCEPSGAIDEGHQFDNLWVASCLSTVMPALTLLLLPLLIPDAKQTDSLLDEGDRDAMSGSLLRRWRGY